MNDKIEHFLEEIADNLGKIVEQLEIINSPENDRDFNRWFYDWNKRVTNMMDVLAIYKEKNDIEKINYYTEELKKLREENYDSYNV